MTHPGFCWHDFTQGNVCPHCGAECASVDTRPEGSMNKLNELPERSGADAPCWYSADQADAWAAGFNAALCFLAPVGRNPEGQDPQGLGAEHEHAVPAEEQGGAHD